VNVLIAGGTGFVGRRLSAALVQRGDVVTVVTRDPATSQARDHDSGISYRGWLPALDGYDAVVNLAGEPIFGRRWNARIKQELRDSRILSTRRIVEALKLARGGPGVLVNASAVGFYGDRGDELLPETAGPGGDFMASLCSAWEAEAARSPVRTVVVRAGVVLGEGGGALATMLPFFRLGIGGPIGLGRQWFSWIHADDLVAMFLLAIDEPLVRGPLNGVAPGTVRNAEFSHALGRVLHRPAFLPVPPLALRVKFGGVVDALTASLRCVPEAPKRLGFSWTYDEVGPALQAVLGRPAGTLARSADPLVRGPAAPV
jgi:uncharacterized protein